jgi:PAS domain S-box-containing protein
MQNFLNDLPGVVYEYKIQKDGSRGFTFVSSTSLDILGLSPQALLEDPSRLRQIVFHEDLPEFELTLQASHETRSAWNWEGRIWYKGALRWIETRSNAYEDGAHTLRRGIIIDISERKQQEAEKEFQYQTLVESLPLAVGIHVGGRIVMANAQAYALLGAKPSELIGRSVMDFVHPDHKAMVLERMQRLQDGENVPLEEEKFVTLAGDTIDVETIARPFTYKGMPAVQLIVRDVTEQNKVKQEIRKNETFFTQLFNNLPMAVVRLNSTGQVELINPGFTEMFGYTLAELSGKNLNDFIVPEEFQSEGMDINNFISTNKVIRAEAVRKNKSGRRVNVILYGMPVRLEDRVIGIYGVYVDITERKRMEEELQVRNSELDHFVYKVSHDLRAPLSSILGLVNLAKFPDNSDSPYHYLNLIGEKANGLDHFISDVLSHSKNLKMNVAVEEVNLKDILLNVISDLSYLNGAQDVEFDIRSDNGPFYSDPWRISEIFRNLVSNAIKYRQQANTKPVVKVDIKITDTAATVVFADNGIGIEKESMGKIFEMFYRATDKSDGSGIGLYIVKNAVEKLNGTVAVDSIAGKGTTFKLELPNQRKSP